MSYTKDGLYLQKKGNLVEVKWRYNEAKKQGKYVAKDVTKEAFAKLFMPITIEKGVVLGDILEIVSNSKTIQAVFSQYFSKELVDEYKKAATSKSDKNRKKQKKWEEIEYLELYQHWLLDSYKNKIEGLSSLCLHGIGVKLKKDILQDGYVLHKKGERINWSVSFQDPYELANLPLKICEEVKVFENDFRKKYRHKYGNVIHRFKFSTPTLGQVIKSIFYDLSFYGTGKTRNNKKDEIMKMAKEVKNKSIKKALKKKSN